jgi:hypothetical protein
MIFQQLPDLVRITNKRDLVPVVPPGESNMTFQCTNNVLNEPSVLSSFRHTGGEKHINGQNVWNACSGKCVLKSLLDFERSYNFIGRDNLDQNCSTGQVLSQGIILADHLGPYAGGIMLGTSSCV